MIFSGRNASQLDGSPDPMVAAACGGALAQAGRLNEAVMHLKQTLTLDPSNTAARENLSRISRK